jgi:hypothetical protein
MKNIYIFLSNRPLFLRLNSRGIDRFFDNRNTGEPKSSPSLILRNGSFMVKKRAEKIVFFLWFLFLQAHLAYAEAQSKEEIEYFLEGLGTFLIQTIGPGILVVGIAIAGISMAAGNEQGIRRGALAAGGGAIIMLSRAILDLIKNITGF